jgi:tetratricopeptide (TPR) repeat protein
MSQHDPSHGSASGSARPGGAPEGRARIGHSGAGFDPVSLRTAVDVGAAEARLAALGQSRSTSALGERADLLRTLGRLDEALAIAEEAFRLAHFTGDRADSTAARIRRAHIFREQGKLERALNDLHTSRITASTEEWHELEAAAAELEGYTLFDLGRHDEAQEALQQALVAFEGTGAPRDRVDGLRRAIEGVLRAYLSGTGPVEPVSAAPAASSPVTAPAAATPAAPAGSSDADARPGDTNPVDLSRPSDALVPTAVPADDVRPAAVAPGSAPAGSWRPSQPAPAGDPQPELPPRADASLWSKISGLAATASAHRERTERAERAADAAHGDGDDGADTRRGATGVTGVVDGLPRDDQPTTWPFPRR